MSRKNKEKRARQRERRKTRTAKDMLKDRAGLLTDEEVFTSSEVKKYITNKLKLITKEFGRKNVKLKLYGNPYDSAVAYTNNSTIFVNYCSLLVTGTREEKHSKILGLCAHEVSHYLFTNFTAKQQWLTYYVYGRIYPSVPKFDGTEAESKAVLLENLTRFQEFLEGKIGCTKSPDPAFTNREWVSRAAQTLRNICEDGRIENLFSNYCTNHRALYFGLLDVIKEQRNQCPVLPDLLEKVEKGELFEYEVLQSLMLHYMRFGEIKGYTHKQHKDEPVVVAFSKIVPYLDEYLEAMDSYTCLTLLNKIIITIWPQIEKFVDDINEKLDLSGQGQDYGPAVMDARSVMIPGTTRDSDSEGEGTDGSEFNKAKPGVNKNPSPKPEYTEETPSGKESGSENASAEESAPSEKNETDEKESGTSASKDDESAASDSSSGNSGTESIGSADKNDSSESTLSTEGEDFSGDSDESASLYKRTSDLLGDLDDGEVSSFDVRDRKEAVADFQEAVEEIAKARDNELAIREIQKDLESLNDDINFGEAHQGVSCSFIRHEVTSDAIAAYDEMKHSVERLVKEMLKKSTLLEVEDDPMEFRNKYSGRRFNASATAKGDYRYFSRDAHIEPNYNLDVIILCDESGSMAGERIRACKSTAICCYEFMNQACGEGHVSVYGHSTRSIYGSSGHVKLCCYADFDSPDSDDRYRLMNMRAGGSNRDGYALRFVKEKIAERDAERKLIIMISDGQPADHGYMGTAAMADIQSVLRECDRDGIMYIAAAIGCDQEVIKTIYGEKHFLDISNLNELPNKLMGLISRLLK